MYVSCWTKLAVDPVTAAVYLAFFSPEVAHSVPPKNLFLQHILQPKSLPEVFP